MFSGLSHCQSPQRSHFHPGKQPALTVLSAHRSGATWVLPPPPHPSGALWFVSNTSSYCHLGPDAHPSWLHHPGQMSVYLSLDKPGTRDPTVSISFLLKSLYSSYIQLEQVQLVHVLRMPSRCAIRNKNSVRLHTYIDHVRPRQKEKKVLPMLVCSVGADVGPSFGFHDGIGNRIPIPVHNLTLDTYEKRRGKKDHNCQRVSLPL